MSFLLSQTRAIYEQFGSFTTLLANGQWRLAKKKKKKTSLLPHQGKLIFLFWLLDTSAISIQNITTKTKLTLY